jgi:PadR family transcriptional regulator, regulatory protein PadR
MDNELIKGTLSLIILSLLSRKPMYGYEIVSTVKEETDGVFQWKAGSLYPCLHKLEKGEFIRGKWEGKPDSRQRKYYHLTKAGREALGEKETSWSQLHRAINHIMENSK